MLARSFTKVSPRSMPSESPMTRTRNGLAGVGLTVAGRVVVVGAAVVVTPGPVRGAVVAVVGGRRLGPADSSVDPLPGRFSLPAEDPVAHRHHVGELEAPAHRGDRAEDVEGDRAPDPDRGDLGVVLERRGVEHQPDAEGQHRDHRA